MQLNDFKPTWQQFKLMGALEPISNEEIMLIIDGNEPITSYKMQRILITAFSFIFLIICCQGG